MADAAPKKLAKMQMAQTPATILAGVPHGGNGWPTLRPRGLARMQLAQAPAMFIRARPNSRQAFSYGFGMQDRRPASGDSPALLQAQTPASTKWGTRSC